MKKRIVSMILALSMVLSILPVSAFADAGTSAAAAETTAAGTNEETTNSVVTIKIGADESALCYLMLSGQTVPVLTTMNAGELYVFFRLRCCTRAQWEIRDHFRAALMAHSFASAPELPKKTFFIPVFSHSSCASFAQGSV